MYRISIIIFVLFFLYSCKDKKPSDPVVDFPIGELELIHSYELNVPEPSGLSFGPGGNTLLTVSDNSNQIYELDFEGNILRVFNFTGRDLEGVTYNPDENLIAVVDERDREVSLVDYESGNKTETFKINIPIGSENSGLEGISYNINNKYYYIVNEINPELLVIWNPVSGIINQENLKFALDYSGVYTDANQSHLWYVSDESQRVYQCDYSNNVLMAFNLGELKFEGIAIDGDMIYLVNDATAKLNIYKIKNN